MWKSKVTQVMTEDVITVHADTSLNVVFELLKENNIHHIPVVNDNKEIVGIISYQDVMQLLHPSTKFNHPNGWLKTKGFLETLLAKEVMTKEVFSLTPESEMQEAAKLLLRNDFHCVPIIHNKQVVGIITPLDIIRYTLLLTKELTV